MKISMFYVSNAKCLHKMQKWLTILFCKNNSFTFVSLFWHLASLVLALFHCTDWGGLDCMPEISANLVLFFILPRKCVSSPLFMVSFSLLCFSVIKN